MKIIVARVIAYVAGLFCILAGIYVLWKPVQTSRQLSFTFQSIDGLSEFIVFYGGFAMGMGVFFLLGAILTRYLEASLLFLALSSFSAMLTRLAILLNNEVSDLFFIFLAGESILFITGTLGVFLCRKRRRVNRSNG